MSDYDTPEKVATRDAEQQNGYTHIGQAALSQGRVRVKPAAKEVTARQLIDAIFDPDEESVNDSIRYGLIFETFERLRVIYESEAN